jgi:hypothetical protein
MGGRCRSVVGEFLLVLLPAFVLLDVLGGGLGTRLLGPQVGVVLALVLLRAVAFDFLEGFRTDPAKVFLELEEAVVEGEFLREGGVTWAARRR